MGFSRKAIDELRKGNAPRSSNGREGLSPRPSPDFENSHEYKVQVQLLREENAKLAAMYEAKRNPLDKAEALFNGLAKNEHARLREASPLATKRFVPLGERERVKAETDKRLDKRRRNLQIVTVEVERKPAVREGKLRFAGRNKLVVKGFGPGF